MIRTSLGHFQCLPYMNKACEDWKEYEQEMDDDNRLTTWKEFKKHFKKKFLTYENQQESLQEAGIANSAIEKEEIQDLFDQRDSTVAPLLVDRNNKLEALNQKFQALLASTTGKPPPPPAQVDINTDLLSVMTELTKTLSSSGFSSSNGKRNNSNSNKDPRLTRKFQTDNYCWSHGSDLAGDYTSANCNYRKTGHQADVTIDDPKDRSKRYLALVRPNS